MIHQHESYYGLQGAHPDIHSKTRLIDQIIHNCKNVQSKNNNRDPFKYVDSIRNAGPLLSPSSSKMNIRRQIPNPTQKLLSCEKRRISRDSNSKITLNSSNSSRQLHDSSVSKIRISRRSPSSSDVRQKMPYDSIKTNQNKLSRESKQNTQLNFNDYFPLRTHQSGHVEKRKSINGQQVKAGINFHIAVSPSYEKQGDRKIQQLAKQIADYKEQHKSYCKQEQRKLRLYYIELQNQLCEMRNRQLQQLSQYENSKIERLEQCNQKIKQKFSEEMRADIEGDLEKIKKEKNMYVGVVQNEAKIVIPGCLVSGANGMLFSFDQSV